MVEKQRKRTKICWFVGFMRRSAIIKNNLGSSFFFPFFFLFFNSLFLFFSFFAKSLKIFEENFISPFLYLTLIKKHLFFYCFFKINLIAQIKLGVDKFTSRKECLSTKTEWFKMSRKKNHKKC